jgi:23S rRNA (uracil1939-C5)-methyltransferase
MARIEALSHEGRGIAWLEGKTVFIDGALPGEEVLFTYTRRRARFDEGVVCRRLTTAPERVEPRCAHFGVCGGCSLQHLDPAAQLAIKQNRLLQALKESGGLLPGHVLPPMTGPLWGYRRKARLGVKYVQKKGKVLVGFREKGSSFLANLQQCEVLHPSVGQRLQALQALLGSLKAHRMIPQIEVAVGDSATVLVLRHLSELDKEDRGKLQHFAERYDLPLYLQPGGLDSITALWPKEAPELTYRLPEAGLEIGFQATDFIQVNAEINHKMVNLALELLDIKKGHRVLDLFCGLGNFTLPLAQRTQSVVGVEGDAGLVTRARKNAQHNGIDNAEFFVSDLNAASHQECWRGRYQYDRVLLDPPRTGAQALIPSLSTLGARRLVYISCNPITLAQDANELTRRYGYRLVSIGVMDMFPHTTHVESIALFSR